MSDDGYYANAIKVKAFQMASGLYPDGNLSAAGLGCSNEEGVMSARRMYAERLVPRVPEATLHQQIAETFKLEIAPAGHISPDGVVWWSQDIANYGGTAPGLRVARGIIKGVPDMIVLYKGIAHFIEVKAPEGEFSEGQRVVAAAILLSEARYGMARHAPEALRLLDVWDIPRKRRVKF